MYNLTLGLGRELYDLFIHEWGLLADLEQKQM